MYINDLITAVNQLSLGVNIDGVKVSILAYADDVVLLAESENDLNIMLDCLQSWCVLNKMSVNASKSKVVHFRNPSVVRTTCVFKCGEQVLEVVHSYNHLGLLLTEHLDYKRMAKAVASSASRALGLLITKFKLLGGMNYHTYTKLYNSMVWSTLEYGVAIWGVYDFSFNNAVQNRAMRFFLGLRMFAPNNAVIGDMGWTPSYVLQWRSVVGFYRRLCHITADRTTRIPLEYFTGPITTHLEIREIGISKSITNF